MLYHDIVDTSAWAKLYSTKLFRTVKFPKGKIYEDIATTYRLFQNVIMLHVDLKVNITIWLEMIL